MNFIDNNVTSDSANEIMGLEEILDRYTNPLNKQMYMELFSIFVDKEEMEIFNSISEMISNEEQLESSDITSMISGLTKRAAIAVFKNAYGLILTEELEIRLVDIHSSLLKLRYLINIDSDRADMFIDIIDDRQDNLIAYREILEELGLDIDFIYNYIVDVDYDFLDTYAKILKEEKDKLEADDPDLEFRLKLNTILSCLTNTLSSGNSDLLNMANLRMTYLKDKDVLEVLNSANFIKDDLANELIVAYKLTESKSSISDYFKEFTENITFNPIEEQERYFAMFQELNDKYKTELSKRMSNE